MRRLLLLLALLACPLSADAAIAVVSGQVASDFANDVVLTFPGNTSVSNHVLVAATIANEGDTASLSGIGTSPVTLHGPTDYVPGIDIRLYIWCYPGDGDDDVTVLTAGSTVARAAAVEISGGSCTEDGTSATGETSASSFHTATMTGTTTGSFAIAFIQATNASDFAATGLGTLIPSSAVDINGLAMGAYVSCTTSCSVAWSSGSENALWGIAAVQEGAAPTNTGMGPTAGVFGR